MATDAKTGPVAVDEGSSKDEGKKKDENDGDGDDDVQIIRVVNAPLKKPDGYGNGDGNTNKNNLNDFK